MILNERQYGITRKKIEEFELAIAELSNSEPPKNRNEQLRQQTYLSALESQLEELKEEVQEYEDLKTGNIESFKLNSFEQLRHNTTKRETYCRSCPQSL